MTQGNRVDVTLIQSAGSGKKQPVHFGRLFGFYHPPARTPWRGVGVVICAPLGTDQTRSDRALRHLAERLAERGFACLRFDPFGTGDSDGDVTSPELVQAWTDGVGSAMRELRARSGATTLSLVGLRMGATFALVHAAESGEADSVVAWSPCASGGSFVKEMVRLHKVYARIDPQLAVAAAEKPADDVEEMLGFHLPRRAVEELARVDLLQLARAPAKRTLVVDGGDVPRRDEIVGKLRDLGAQPELRSHPGQKFLVTASHRSALPEDALSSIVGWLTDAYPGSSTDASPDPQPGGDGPVGERAVVIPGERPLFGVLSPAQGTPKAPAILLSNAGCVNRSGAHRLYVTMARRWAAAGFDVLRLDLPGIGDTPAAPGEPESIVYPSTGLEDLQRAIASFGGRSVIAAGLCSGGDYAFQLGSREPKLAGAWMLNPRTFCVLDLAAVESGDGRPPTTPVEDVPRALRAMAERGLDVVLLVSHRDPGVSYVDAHAGAAMSSLSAVRGFRRIDIGGTDHTFTPVVAQRQVTDLLSRHLANRQ